MQLDNDEEMAPFEPTRGVNLCNRRALAMTFTHKPSKQACRVVNWHAVDGKWAWVGDAKASIKGKEDAVRRIVQNCHDTEMAVLAKAQDNDNVEYPWVVTGDFNKITNNSCEHVLNSLPADYNLTSAGMSCDLRGKSSICALTCKTAWQRMQMLPLT